MAKEQQRLAQQAYAIEALLASHRVSVRVWNAAVTPRFVRFQLTAPIGTRLSRVLRLHEEIALALGARSARVFRRGGVIYVEVPLPRARPVHLDSLIERCEREGSLPPLAAILGLDDDGKVLLLRVPAPDVAHVLIAGTTGSGKTALARTLIVSLAVANGPEQLRFILIDPKNRGFRALGRLPHVYGEPISTQEETVQALEWLVTEMQERDHKGVSWPRLFLVIDELADLIQTGGSEVESCLSRLGQRGREAGIHVIACTQKPTAALIGGVLKANFPVRLVGAVTSPEEAKIASGLAGTGAEHLLGRGDFLLVGQGQLIRFQAAWINPTQLDEMVNSLRSGKTDYTKRKSAQNAGDSEARPKGWNWMRHRLGIE